jgi:hypothetical protein
MKPAFAFLISQTVLIPLFIGLFRFDRLRQAYLPLLWMLFLGFLTEAVSFVLIRKFHRSNAIPCNLDVLAEGLLLLWQFRRWGMMKKKKRLLYGLAGALICFWLVENAALKQIVFFSPYYRFFYSFLVVLWSVNEINYMITHESRNLFRNPKFLICTGFVIYYVYKIVYEWAYQVSLYGQTGFTAGIEFFFAYINALVNLLFAVAFLLIPARERFRLSALD